MVFKWLYFFIIFVFLAPVFSYTAEINSIEFEVTGGVAKLQILSDEPIQYQTSENEPDKQIVIDLQNAKLAISASRKLDTSSFNSPVTLVSPYTVDESTGQSRVVVQLREMVAPEVSQEGGTLTLSFGKVEDADFSALDGGAAGSGEGGTSSAKSALDAMSEDEAEEDAEVTKIDDFLNSRKSQVFIGKPITLKVQNANVIDVLRLIGDSSGFNIVIGSGVAGTISLSLIDVPWDQVLDVVLRTKTLGAERNKNILRVMTLQNLTREKQLELSAKAAAQKIAPRVTKVFPISFADISSLSSLLTSFGTDGVVSGAQPTISVDERTNSIVVQDIPENIERMEKLVKLLDFPTPQVLIEAKVVEATEGFAESINGDLGFISPASTTFHANFNDFSSGTVPADLSGVISGATEPTGSAAFGLSPSLGFLPGNMSLYARLTMLENENKVKIISSPRTVVLNKQQASIVSTEPFPITQTVASDTSTVTSTTFIDAELSLNVTPTVTNDQSVLLQLEISKDVVVAGSGIGQRNLNTNILVDNGSTLVIGGIYTSSETIAEGGFPILRKIPIIGRLFGFEGDSVSRTELFIFVTPRILNLKSTGLVT